jgi:hypothetical protein
MLSAVIGGVLDARKFFTVWFNENILGFFRDSCRICGFGVCDAIIFVCDNKGGDMKTKQEIQEAIDEYDTAIDFEQDESEKDKLKAQRMALQWVLE